MKLAASSTASSTLDEKRERLSLWQKTMGLQQQEWSNQQQRRNREAEEAHVRKSVWGEASSNQEVGDTFLGDVTQHHHAAVKTGNSAKTIAAAGLAAIGLGIATSLPIAVWQMFQQTNNQNEATQPPANDSDRQYGLMIYRDEK
jgi:hypothetical protein